MRRGEAPGLAVHLASHRLKQTQEPEFHLQREGNGPPPRTADISGELLDGLTGLGD